VTGSLEYWLLTCWQYCNCCKGREILYYRPLDSHGFRLIQPHQVHEIPISTRSSIEIGKSKFYEHLFVKYSLHFCTINTSYWKESKGNSEKLWRHAEIPHPRKALWFCTAIVLYDFLKPAQTAAKTQEQYRSTTKVYVYCTRLLAYNYRGNWCEEIFNICRTFFEGMWSITIDYSMSRMVTSPNGPNKGAEWSDRVPINPMRAPIAQSKPLNPGNKELNGF
jgi:hypothetical protein